MSAPCATWFTSCHVRITHENPPSDHRSADSGGRADRRGLFERGDRAAARHLPPHSQGPLRHPATEARDLETPPDSRCLPIADRAGSPVEEPRASPKRPRGLTAPAPAADPPAGAGQLSERSRHRLNGDSVRVDRRLITSRGDGDRGSGTGCNGGAPAPTPQRPGHPPPPAYTRARST